MITGVVDGEVVDVVVVEDTEDDALITMRGLKRLSPAPTVRLIEDGADAIATLAAANKSQPKLVFLDLKLPKVHGLEILEAMKACSATKDTPVVILTSSAEPRDVNRARELGCVDYITKPIDWNEYVRLVCKTAARYISGTVCKLD